jgi:hypothetical protein
LITGADIIMETMMSFRRAGADLILTHHAPEVAKILKRGRGKGIPLSLQSQKTYYGRNVVKKRLWQAVHFLSFMTSSQS